MEGFLLLYFMLGFQLQ